MTAAGDADLDFPALLRLRGETDDGLGEWSELGVEAEFEFLLAPLAEQGVDVPEVGVDLPGPRGLTSGVEAEMLWESHKIAVLAEVDAEVTARVDPAWRLFALDALASDPSPLLAALREKPTAPGLDKEPAR